VTGTGDEHGSPRSVVWIADDSATERAVAVASLRAEHDVVAFASAAQALEALITARPDLLVLDWHMPDLSGADACRFVRERADDAQLPILVLTASSDRDTLLDAFGAGANDFVRKPFDGEELRVRIGTLIRTKRLHDALRRAEAQLTVEASRRERLIGVLAHDLRQPMHLVTMAMPVLGDESLPREVRQKVAGRAIAATERMSRMIGDLLDLARSQGGGFPITTAPADLVAITRQIVDEVRTTRPERTIVFAPSEDATHGAWDVDRMSQVVSNLIENALRHGAPESAVTVAITDDAGTVALTVSNEGVLDADPTRLFRAFDRGAAPSGNGLGLGLYIVDQIVRAHGGEVGAESGDGLVHFRVRLPR